MTYRISDLMDFELVTVERLFVPGEPPRLAISCTVCLLLVVDDVPRAGPADLADVLDPCVEHRKTCRPGDG